MWGARRTDIIEPLPMGERRLLALKNMVKVYGERRVVDGVSLEVRTSEVVGLLGKNGAGKTTTFRMAVGMIRPTAGAVLFGGGDVTRKAMYERARMGLGYLPQEHSVFAGLTARENIEAVLELRGGSGARRRRERTEKLLAELGLQKAAGTKAGSLSGGEKRRLEIARALATEPKIFLLDEPFTGIDPIAIAEIKEIVAGLARRGIGVLITDHNVRDTLTIVERAYILEEGRILASGRPWELVKSELVRSVYLGEGFEASFEEEMKRWRRARESEDVAEEKT